MPFVYFVIGCFLHSKYTKRQEGGTTEQDEPDPKTQKSQKGSWANELRKHEMHETRSMIRISILLSALAFIVSSCAPNQRIVKSSAELAEANVNQAATPVQPSLEKDIDAMRTADFVFIYVIKRKDRGPLDAEDKKFASAVIPGEMNRRTVAEEGKAILIGSNFRMPDESRKLIEERFGFEDLSREVQGANSNANVQANR